MQAVYPTLDAFLVAWGQWVLREDQLHADAAQQESVRQHRRAILLPEERAYCIPIQSFRTYLNAVARVFSQEVASTTKLTIVPSAVRQFPLLNAFLNPVITRARARTAVSSVRFQPQSPLLPEELPLVVTTVDSQSPLRRQQVNIRRVCLAAGS